MLNIENSNNSEIFVEIIKKLSERILEQEIFFRTRILEQEKIIIELELKNRELRAQITINTITVFGSKNKIYQDIDKFTFDRLLDKD